MTVVMTTVTTVVMTAASRRGWSSGSSLQMAVTLL
jgi:hypothetical protein